MERLKEVLAFVNNKGGVAKTTTVQNTAAGLLRLNPNYRVLCIDLDPQGNLSSLLGWGKKRKQFSSPRTMYDVMRDGFNEHLPVYKSRDGLFYCPASASLANIEPDLHRQMNPKLVLNQLLGNALKYMEQANGIDTDKNNEDIVNAIQSFDYVLIDCAPALSELTYNALGAATGVIIPMGLDSLSVAGLPPMARACQMVQQQLNRNMRMRGLLITKADERTNLARSITESVRAEYDGDVFKSRIRECVKVKESQAMQQDIFEYSPSCTAAIDYESFVKELLNTEE